MAADDRSAISSDKEILSHKNERRKKKRERVEVLK